jgi:L-rhamnose mutarotase
MVRNAFTMKLKKGFEAEYKKRHDEIWPELARELSAAGIHNYSIFLDSATLTLFAYQELDEANSTSVLNSKPIMKRWYDHMMDIMETNADHSARMNPLSEVFHLQ